MTIAERATTPRVPESEITHRHQRLRRAMIDAELPLALFTHPVDIYYLTGTMPDGRLLFPADGQPVLEVRKSLERAHAEASGVAVVPQARFGTFVADLEKRVGAGPIGLTLDVLPAANYRRLAESLPNVTWRDATPLIRGVRAIKSAWEIDRHRRAAAQHEVTFQTIAAHLAPGMDELHLSSIAEATMRREGHQGLVRFRRPGMELWFCTLGTGFGPAYPTSFDGPMGSDGLHPASGMVAGRRVIEKGVPVMADILGNHEGYHADITQTFCIGQPPDQIKSHHAFCVETLARVRELLRPGIAWGEVFAIVDAWAKDAGEPTGFMGYGDNRVKFFGHGIGLEVDELPILAKGFEQPLEEGMVVAVEPKAYDPEWGPAGLERSFVVTANGAEPLLDYPEEIVVV